MPHRAQHGPLGHQRRDAGALPDVVREIGMQLHLATAIGEGAAVARVQVALRRQALGQQHGMGRLAQAGLHLHVEIGHLVRFLLQDRGAVQQVAHGDQPAIQQKRVVGRKPQVAERCTGAEGAGFDTHRQHIARARMAPALQRAVADPAHLQRGAEGRQHLVAGVQILHRHRPIRRGQARAGAEAGILDRRGQVQRRARAGIEAVVAHGGAAQRHLAGGDVPEDIAADRGRGVGAAHGAVVAQQRRWPAGGVVDEHVPAHRQAGVGVGGKQLAAQVHEGAVLRLRALFDHVAGDGGRPAIRQVHGVVADRVRPVLDAVVGDDRLARPALDLMAAHGVVEIAVGDRKLRDVVHVDVVRVAVAGAVVVELAGVDRNRPAVGGRRQDAVLVVVEPGAGDDQRPALVADAGPVAVWHGGAGELEVVERHVGVDGQDRLAVGRLGHRLQLRQPAHALDRQVVPDSGEIVGVGAGIDQDGIPAR